MLLIGRYYLFLLREKWKVWRQFYRYPQFKRVDKTLQKAYRWKNPYRICKQFLKSKGARDVYAYGETPLTVWDKIARYCNIRADDTVVDLGCGRGRGVLFLASTIGCKVHGIDWVPEFIHEADAVRRFHSISQATFSCGDMCAANLSGASVIYLYGTCLDDLSLQRMIHTFQQLPIGTRIVTVSYPLDELHLLKQFSAEYPWGTTNVYLHEVSPSYQTRRPTL